MSFLGSLVMLAAMGASPEPVSNTASAESPSITVPAALTPRDIETAWFAGAVKQFNCKLVQRGFVDEAFDHKSRNHAQMRDVLEYFELAGWETSLKSGRDRNGYETWDVTVYPARKK